MKQSNEQKAYSCRYYDATYDHDFCNRYSKRIKTDTCRDCEEYKEYERITHEDCKHFNPGKCIETNIMDQCTFKFFRRNCPYVDYHNKGEAFDNGKRCKDFELPYHKFLMVITDILEY